MEKINMTLHTAATICCVLLLLILGIGNHAGAGSIESALRVKLESTGPNDEIQVIIKLAEKADLDKIKDKEKRVRRAKIIRELRETGAVPQKRLQAFLEKKKIIKKKLLWLINGIAATVPAALVAELAAFPGVEAVTLDAVIHAPVTTYGTAAAPAWNISAIKAPDLWSLGYTGAGIVVANMDSGVDGDQPDLLAKWRGGSNSWFDPNGEHVSPTGNINGHGTQTMGIMVGGVASGASFGGTSFGVAPGAQWIAVKIFNDADLASFSAIHAGYQWLLDPDGDPETDDAPHVVNNSWGLESNVCNTEFQADVQTLKTAGIAQVFSAGNDGPNPLSSVSPGNYPESFSVGAVDNTNMIANFSSRGPSACGGDIYPKVVAPGVDILTTDLFLGVPDASYTKVLGTSFAAPHVAGAMALLLSAFPALDVPTLEAALLNATTDLGVQRADNDYGHGLINVLKTYNILNTRDSIGVFRAGQWYLDNNGSKDWNAGDTVFEFGSAGDVPVAVDWNGDGLTDLGVFRGNGLWYLDMNGSRAWDAGDVVYQFGSVGDMPVTGDWNGTGSAKAGVFRDNGLWYLDINGNGAWDAGDIVYKFGSAGDIPVTGDWSGTGTSKVGVFRGSGLWYLDMNGNGLWDIGDAVYQFGSAGDIPVTGDWNGDGITEVGIIRGNGVWYVDANSSHVWDFGDTVFKFGSLGDSFMTWKW